MTRLTRMKATRNTSTYISFLTLTVALAIGPLQRHDDESWPPHKRARWDDEAVEGVGVGEVAAVVEVVTNVEVDEAAVIAEVDEVEEILTQWTTITQELPLDEVAAIEESILSARSGAMEEEESPVLHMSHQVELDTNDEASASHEAVLYTSSPQFPVEIEFPVEVDPGPSRLMGEESDQHRVTPDNEPQISLPNLPLDSPSLLLETRNTTLAEACVAYPLSLKAVGSDRAFSVETLRCSLQYIARCYEAGQGASPDDHARLGRYASTSKLPLAIADVKACIFFDTDLDFRLLRLLLTAWNNKLPVIQVDGYSSSDCQSIVRLLAKLLNSDWKKHPFLTAKYQVRKHRTWMIMLMQKLAAETGPITPSCVLRLMVEGLTKKIDWCRMCQNTNGDPDEWIADMPTYALIEAAKGAAKLLRVLASCPLNLLSDAELSRCFKGLETAHPVYVCERIWHTTVAKTQEAAPPSQYEAPEHWTNIGPDHCLSPIASALYSTAHKEGFWARVSWLFHHKFAPVAKRVETIWSLPHERQEAKDIVDVAAAIDACVGEAHQELSSQVPYCVGINFASVFRIVPAITLLKTHNAILLPSDFTSK